MQEIESDQMTRTKECKKIRNQITGIKQTELLEYNKVKYKTNK